jgi:Mrp family chromosome partitioning ATPase
MAELIEMLRREYQFVIFDTPPILAVADTTVLARACDGVIYLVWAGRTHRDVAMAGKQKLIDVGAKLIGGILNSSRPEAERGYGYSYYYYGKREGGGPQGNPSGLP